MSTYNLPPNSHKLSSTVGGTKPRTFTYDAMGNLTNDGKYTNTYLNNGRLRTVVWTVGTTTNTVTHDLNALGQRVRKTAPSSVSGTRRFMYDESGRLAGEYDSAGKLVQETIWLGDLPVATLRQKSGSTTTPIAIDIFYVHADHLGTRRAITRPTDNKVVWSWENTEAFGNNLPNENPSALGAFKYNLRMPGQHFDQETWAHYNYFRDYDSSLGRYIESDPVGLKAGLTTYAYVGGNPLTYFDPYGLDSWGDQPGAQWGTKPGVPLPPPGQLWAFISCTRACLGARIVVTSTTERTATHLPGTPHGDGQAFDFRYSQDPDAALCCAKQCGAQFGLNEYANPSPAATAGHIHVQLVPGKRGGSGNLPSDKKCKPCK